MIRINWSLTKRLVGWGLVMALIVLALAGFCIYRVALLQEYANTSYKDATVPLKAWGQFVMAFATLQSQITEHVATSETPRMNQIESEIETTLKQAAGFLKDAGSARDAEVDKQWEGIILLLKDAVNQSKGYRKFEALNTMVSGAGLELTLALNKKISQLLTETVQ